MKVSLPILVGLWISLFCISGCMNRAQSFRMLDKRAEYEDLDNPKSLSDPALSEGGIEGYRNGPVPVRTRPKIASIWIHPHEMASHDYFWGGWMSVVTEPDQWVLSQAGMMPPAPGIESASAAPKLTKARVPGARPKLKK